MGGGFIAHGTCSRRQMLLSWLYLFHLLTSIKKIADCVFICNLSLFLRTLFRQFWNEEIKIIQNGIQNIFSHANIIKRKLFLCPLFYFISYNISFCGHNYFYLLDLFLFSAIIWLKYCQCSIKHYPINQLFLLKVNFKE